MLNLNISSSNQQELQGQAYQHYLHREYAESLNLYTEALKQPAFSVIKQAFIEATIAILYIHMNNYQQAYAILSELAERMPSLNPLLSAPAKQNQRSPKRPQESNYSQYLVLGLKVRQCLHIGGKQSRFDINGELSSIIRSQEDREYVGLYLCNTD
jgi:tetratricopeptide (TPR) repeat protein